MATGNVYFVAFTVISFLLVVSCLPERGKKDLKFDKNHTYGFFQKTMNKGYSVAVRGRCDTYKGKIKVAWLLAVEKCADWYSSYLDHEKESTIKDVLGSFLTGNRSLYGEDTVDCSTPIHLKDVTDTGKEMIPSTKPSEDDSQTNEMANAPSSKQSPVAEGTNLTSSGTKKLNTKAANSGPNAEERIRRSDNMPVEAKKEGAEGTKPKSSETKTLSAANSSPRDGKPVEAKKEGAEGTKPKSSGTKTKMAANSSPRDDKDANRVCVTMGDGVFVFFVHATPLDSPAEQFHLTLNVELKGPHGYLSASDWPLYPFYGFMSLLYVFYGIVWLVVSACQWRDLLRIQFWIGGVIALGMLEKAVFFSEYNELNITGVPNQSLTIFAELVSCVKRTLARVLVIIVSMGFGIVKPRLGSTLHRVLGVGALYFILATLEGCFRSLHPKSDPGKQQLIVSIPLAVLDASICWWIFMSLVQTTRTLRIRRNVVKLSLYRHFTNTLIFAVLASVAYMIWSIKTHRFAKDGCITEWSELWLDEAFWHFLFSIVLLVIMILWRPTANNQRYSFTPIVDFGDDDEDDDNMTLSDAFDGMKMRNVKNVPEVQINGDSKRKHKPEDDLKWVEENIPSSAADVVLPSVLDSDEELMTTKFEMSKME